MTFEQLWQKNYELAKQFYEQNKHLRIPISYEIDGYAVGIWIHNMREAYKRFELSEQRIKLLEDIKMEWCIYYKDWLENYKKLFENSYGEKIINILNDKELIKWMKKQKNLYDAGTISDDKKILMKKNINIFELSYLKWEYYYYLANQFYNEYHHLNIPLKYTINGINLGYWIADQRNAYEKDLLTQDQIIRLEQIGMIWCIYEYRFITNTIDKYNKKNYKKKLEVRFYQFLEQQSHIAFTEYDEVKEIGNSFQKYLNYVKK